MQQQRQTIQEAQRAKLRESYRQKYYDTDGQKPLGNYKLIMSAYHKGEAFLTLGPNYLFFAISFVIINIFTVALLSKLNKSQDTKTFFFILVVAIIFLDTVWLATALINPGIATSNSEAEGEICQVCQADNGIQVVKQLGRYHCEQCDVCIDEHEAHFKVIGGCVGKNNFIGFKLLLLGIFLWGLSMITIFPQTLHM